ncbi:carbapenem antibiotics biosynthesis protein card [Patellaria atrata CBS 101060]|uniref:Proline dehydrogenase n=1 Tax=Patellaria atrata CBS 101060 TaxID=1346257 RepID=A0A9P4SFP3_9PEZI|nr:carbapenem antibiotics biosynthesis protein card [Patellaria atrata CBS 101060]
MRNRLSRIHNLNGLSVQLLCQSKRHVHSSRAHNVSAATTSSSGIPEMFSKPSAPTPKKSPLSILPLSSVLRSYMIASMSRSPRVLDATFAFLVRLLRSRSIWTDIERNPILRWTLRNTFYAQFCAGENQKEVAISAKETKSYGFQGIILEYALERLGGEDEAAAPDSKETATEIETFRSGMIETIDACNPGDFIALKWSGLGGYALQLMKQNKPPTPVMEAAMTQICDRATLKGVKILPGAEEESTNTGIYSWTMNLQKRYNTRGPGKVVVYSTYQAYLKSTPGNLAKHLAYAKKEDFTMGVKLVRGAYLATEPRHIIWESKEKTDEMYDALAEACLKREYTRVLPPAHQGVAFPEVDVVLATHNLVTVRKAQAIRNQQLTRGEPRVTLAYAQLKGMADEVSCELAQGAKSQADDGSMKVDPPMVYKDVPWGTMTQCLNYLLRRAAENKDAAMRVSATRKAMGAEIWRRAKGAVGLY